MGFDQTLDSIQNTRAIAMANDQYHQSTGEQEQEQNHD